MWVNVWFAIGKLARAIDFHTSGKRSTDRPVGKNVALTLYFFRMARICLVLAGFVPSSNVRAMTFLSRLPCESTGAASMFAGGRHGSGTSGAGGPEGGGPSDGAGEGCSVATGGVGEATAPRTSSVSRAGVVGPGPNPSAGTKPLRAAPPPMAMAASAASPTKVIRPMPRLGRPPM